METTTRWCTKWTTGSTCTAKKATESEMAAGGIPSFTSWLTFSVQKWRRRRSVSRLILAENQPIAHIVITSVMGKWIKLSWHILILGVRPGNFCSINLRRVQGRGRCTAFGTKEAATANVARSKNLQKKKSHPTVLFRHFAGMICTSDKYPFLKLNFFRWWVVFFLLRTRNRPIVFQRRWNSDRCREPKIPLCGGRK